MIKVGGPGSRLRGLLEGAQDQGIIEGPRDHGIKAVGTQDQDRGSPGSRGQGKGAQGSAPRPLLQVTGSTPQKPGQKRKADGGETQRGRPKKKKT